MSLLGRIFRSPATAAYDQALELYNADRYDEAVSAFKDVLRQLRGAGHPHRKLARLYLSAALSRSGFSRSRQGDMDGAETDLRKAIEADPGFPDLHFQLGRLLADQGRHNDALGCFDEALLLNPRYLAARSWRALVLWKMNRQDESVGEFVRCVEDGLELPGEIPSKLYDKSTTDWIRSVETLLYQEREADTHTREAVEAYAHGDRELALKQLRTAVRKKPRCADARCRLGALLMEMGSCIDALEQFDAALELNPRHVDGLVQRGVCLIHLDRPAEAIELLNRALPLEPDALDTRIILTLAFLRSGRFGDAASEIGALQEELPEDPRVHYLAAASHALMGNEEASLGNLQRSGKDGFLIPAVVDLGSHELMSGRPKAALALARKGLTNYPEEERLRLLEGSALLQTGKDAARNARTVLEPLLESARAEVVRQAALALGALALDEGRIDDGLDALVKVRRNGTNDPEVLRLRGRLLLEDGETEPALLVFRDALQPAVPAVDLMRDLALAFFRGGAIPDGIRWYREAWYREPFRFPSTVMGDPGLVDEI